MQLLKQINTKLLSEEGAGGCGGGAVGGGAVAGFAMPLFKSIVKRPIAGKDEKPKKRHKNMKLKEVFVELKEQGIPAPQNANYDTSEVFAKMKSLEKKETTPQEDFISFGLEDEGGGVVKVSVKREQAEGFERALNHFLSREDKEGKRAEIAEVLFQLKDHFDILDVEWPPVEEDEAEEQQVNVPTEEMPPEGEMDATGDAPMPDADTGEATSLLTQVIDMMKADADARKAEAVARQKEAEVRVGKASADQAFAKVKQEEQILDMEAWEKQKKEEEKEAKRLAKLARWKHEMEDKHGASFEPIDDNAEEDIVTASKDREGDIDQMAYPSREEEEGTFSRRPPHAQPRPQKLRDRLELIQQRKKELNAASLAQQATKRMNRYQLIGREHYQDEEKGNKIKGRVKPHDVASFILNRIK